MAVRWAIQLLLALLGAAVGRWRSGWWPVAAASVLVGAPIGAVSGFAVGVRFDPMPALIGFAVALGLVRWWFATSAHQGRDLVMVATALLDRGEHTAALAMIRELPVRALERDPTFGLIDRLGQRQQWVDALSLCDRWLRIAPTDPILLEARPGFFLEARLLAAIDHPNVIRVLDFGEGPVPYMAIEFIEGRNLRQLLADGA